MVKKNENIRNNILAVGILAGAVIGAGIFSLPFVFSQVGVLNGLIYLMIAGAAVAAGHFLYADLVIKAGVYHNFVGYSRRYLGTAGYWLAILISVVQMLLVLVVYLILSRSFFNLILGFDSFSALVVFWLAGSMAIFFSLRRLASVESVMVISVAAIVLLIFLIALPRMPAIAWNDIFLSLGGFLTAVGPLFFALSGRTAVVELVRFAKKPPLVKKSTVLGTMFPAVVYGLFALSVIALSPAVSRDAVSGLIGVLPYWLLAAVGVLGLLSILSSYMAVGFDVNDVLKFDLRWPRPARATLVIGTPLILYLIGFQDFLWLVSFTGGVFGALGFLFVVLMWLKATGRRSVWAIILLLFFAGILVDQVVRFLL